MCINHVLSNEALNMYKVSCAIGGHYSLVIVWLDVPVPWCQSNSVLNHSKIHSVFCLNRILVMSHLAIYTRLPMPEKISLQKFQVTGFVGKSLCREMPFVGKN